MGSSSPASYCMALPLLLFLYIFSGALALSPNQTTPQFPALFIFGDSIVDTGNNNNLLTIIKSNFPPYGIDFPGQQPTGRFCNGRIASDFLASRIHLKELLPPYLGLELTSSDILTGVSFASAGTGYDPVTSSFASVLSMEDQLNLFQEYTAKLNSITTTEAATTIITKGLYIVCSGNNDLANNYFITPFRKPYYDLPSYVKLMTTFALSFIKQLYEDGARIVGFVGLPPVGCVPAERTLAGGFQRDCDPVRNEAALLFNSIITMEIDKLQRELQGIRIIYVDIYSILIDIIKRPSIYGFEESSKACCGTGELEVSILCNSKTSSTCEDHNKYVFWDSYHPTERCYEILVDKLYNKYFKSLLM